MVEAYIFLHPLFGVSIWRHAIGETIHLALSNQLHCGGTIEVHHRQTLRWALGALVDLRNAFLYLSSGTVSIWWLIVRHKMQFFGEL